MEGLVLADLLPSVMSVEVSVTLPAVFKVTLKVLLPETNAPLAGKVAFRSLGVRPAVSVTLFTRSQLASTSLTVTLNDVPAAWPLGVPVLPVALPGAAVSPGTRICNLAKDPTLTAIRSEEHT